MEQTQGRGAGPHAAKGDRIAQILPQEQEAHQASRARQGEATGSQQQSFLRKGEWKGLCVASIAPSPTPTPYSGAQGTTAESERGLQGRAWHTPPPPPLGVLRFSPPHKYLSVFGV